MKKTNPIEARIETFLFASRWLMAPFYLGLVLALLALLAVFLKDLVENLPLILSLSRAAVIIWLLGLIDLSLVGNLLVTVILAGYENFISKIEKESHPDWPSWISTLDFGGMKLKLIASIIAITAIHLLEIFMTPEKLDTSSVGWLLAIQGTILASGLALAVTDYISERTKQFTEKH
jgi:uncharacterized protein (TIGR00645 family)